MGTKQIAVELQYHGSGKIEGRNGRYSGGVVAPELGDHVMFQVRPSALDANGIFNPDHNAPTYGGGLQVIVEGDAAGYRALGTYLLALAELDTGAHPRYKDYHQITSRDGRTSVQLLFYRQPGSASEAAGQGAS